jgi:hypothetical protein
LEEGIQSTAQSLIEHGLRLETEGTKLKIPGRVGEVWMVEGIEGIRAELEIHPFGDREFPTQGEVHLHQAKAGDVISPLCPLPDNGRYGKGRWIQTLAARGSGI